MSIIVTQRRIIAVTPTLDTNAYANNDHMGTVMELSGGAPPTGALLDSLVVVDKGGQSKGFTVLLFNAEPTVASVDNAALDIVDAQMATKFIGSLTVVTADYKTVSGSSFATFRSLGLEITGTDGAFYAIMRADEAQTHAAADLVLKFGVRCG